MDEQDYTDVVIELEYEGASPASEGWPGLKQLMDAITKALKSMPEGPEPEEIVPVSWENGCIACGFKMPTEKFGAMETFAKGDSPDWRPEMRRGCKPFWDYAKKRGAAVSFQAGGLDLPVRISGTVQRDRRPWLSREYTTLRATVIAAGGIQGDVSLQFDGHRAGKVVCAVGRDMAADIAAYLYKKIDVHGRATVDVVRNAVKAFEVDDFTPIITDTETLDRYDRLIGDALDGFDVGAFMREQRGEE